MPDGAETTMENWQALRRLAAMLLARMRREHPDWSAEDLVREIELPRSKLMAELLAEAGFERKAGLSRAEEKLVLRAMLGGVFSPREISSRTHLPLKAVKEFLGEVGVPYGAGGFGMFPWPGSKKAGAEGGQDAVPSAELRRASSRGQVSYMGHTYGLGVGCAGRTCWVAESGERLVVFVAGREPEVLHKKSG